MSAAVVALCLLLLLGVLSLPAISFARRRSSLFLADCALLVVPTFLLIAALVLLNEPAERSFAIIVYPFLCAALCVVLLWLRVFLLTYLPVSPRSLSVSMLAVSCVIATAVGAFVLPIYE